MTTSISSEAKVRGMLMNDFEEQQGGAVPQRRDHYRHATYTIPSVWSGECRNRITPKKE